MEEILTQLRAALMAHTALPVYFSYDPSPFDQRKTQFLVLGVESMEMQPSFLTDTSQPLAIAVFAIAIFAIAVAALLLGLVLCALDFFQHHVNLHFLSVADNL